MEEFTRGTSALGAVRESIATLESNEWLNAGNAWSLSRKVTRRPIHSTTVTGYGSNLTINGTVECDASLMEGGSNEYGSVGAASGQCPLW